MDFIDLATDAYINALGAALGEYGLTNHQDAVKVCQWLADQYAQPSRHYHNNVHIYRMMNITELYPEMKELAERWEIDMTIYKLAVMFHDVVYDGYPKTQSNEEMSVEVAENMLTLFEFPDNVCDLVLSMIQHTDYAQFKLGVTPKHMSAQGIHHIEFMRIADFIDFGSFRTRMINNSINVVKEMLFMYPNTTMFVGTMAHKRIGFLKYVLDNADNFFALVPNTKDRIVANIEYEISLLEKCDGPIVKALEEYFNEMIATGIGIVTDRDNPLPIGECLECGAAVLSELPDNGDSEYVCYCCGCECGNHFKHHYNFDEEPYWVKLT